LITLMLFLRTCRRRFAKAFKAFAIGSVCLLFCLATQAEAPLSKEDKLKAAYLLNFTKFIEWPESDADERQKTIRICIASSPKFLAFLNEMARNVRVGKLQRPVNVLPLSTAKQCELVYTRQSRTANNEKLHHAVVVVDSPEVKFPTTSIVFYEKNKKLRFEIDRDNISKTQVVVSSELMKLAKIK